MDSDFKVNATHKDIIHVLNAAKSKGLKVAAHIGESAASLQYANDLINVSDRIGHGTLLVHSPSHMKLGFDLGFLGILVPRNSV